METKLIIEIIILLISVYLAFFKSYLTEKGKSAALKEDLQDLTREVESVKNEFVKEQEMMKTDLQRILNNEISYRNEERDAIINFHGMVNQWLYSILEISLGDYDRNNVSDLKDMRNKISTFYAKTGIAKSKIMLLVEDNELTKSASDLHLAVIKFYYWADYEFLKYQQNCEMQKSLIERYLIISKIDGNESLERNMAKEEQELKDEQMKIYEEYIKTNRNLQLEKTQPHKENFEVLAKEYLKR